MPTTGQIVHAFPDPKELVSSALHRLQLASVPQPDLDENQWWDLAALPRPWDPATCPDELRTAVYTWLDDVAIWLNDQHLWALNRPGIPECWPAHPHLVHDLAVVACARYLTCFAVAPTSLDLWHTQTLPHFLERLRDRLGEGCQPGGHQAAPRHDRNQRFASAAMRETRSRRLADDQSRTSDRLDATPTLGDANYGSKIHDTW